MSLTIAEKAQVRHIYWLTVKAFRIALSSNLKELSKISDHILKGVYGNFPKFELDIIAFSMLKINLTSTAVVIISRITILVK